MIARRSFARRALLALAAPVLLAVVVAPAGAQGKGKGGHGGNADRGGASHGNAAGNASHGNASGSASHASKGPKVPPGQAKKHVTHDQAVDASRRVLVEQGYVVQRVERVGDTRVIYYYRGNNGRGKGHGPLERMVVRPSSDRYVFSGAPAAVLRAVTIRLGF